MCVCGRYQQRFEYLLCRNHAWGRNMKKGGLQFVRILACCCLSKVAFYVLSSPNSPPLAPNMGLAANSRSGRELSYNLSLTLMLLCVRRRRREKGDQQQKIPSLSLSLSLSLQPQRPRKRERPKLGSNITKLRGLKQQEEGV